MQILLFCLGLALGSFLHVLASRYDPDRFILTRDSLGGRSYCPGCGKTLAWYELIPLLSFLIQRGRCRGCGAVIGWSYFGVELVSGLIVALAPMHVIYAFVPGDGPDSLGAAAIWTLVFLVLLLITLIDIRLQIIPDELVILLGLLGMAVAASQPLAGGLWLGHVGAAFGAALFFGALLAITRGRGMGFGDVKLSFVLGLLFGWPSILLLLMLAFVIGALVGIGLIATGSKGLKSAVPFGPFLAIAAGVTFFFGQPLIQNWYNLMI